MQPDLNLIPSSAHTSLRRLQSRLNQALIGQAEVVERLLICLLCNGNLLLEGLPGTAKTRLIKALASQLDASLGRIQFTPDLLPGDVTGTDVLHHQPGRSELRFEPGPVFNNLVLADEINRAPAKVQSALLEAMEERQVTVAGHSHPLPELFMVLATQNPLEQEGTYPLPEAQQDRFLLKVQMAYADDVSERLIMQQMRAEEGRSLPVSVAVSQAAIFSARQQIREVQVSPAMDDYIVALIMATREPQRYDPALTDVIEVGASSRASIALDRCARASAWLAGRNHVQPDDVRRLLPDVLRHRIHLSYAAQARGDSVEQLIERLLSLVPMV